MSFVGYVFDDRTLKPVSRTRVVATLPELQAEQTAVTDDDGEYSSSGCLVVRTGFMPNARATAPGFKRTSRPRQASAFA